ncbi:MAG: isoleucine--tRNA ligase, partial [Anaeroplasmataceae bacterium]
PYILGDFVTTTDGSGFVHIAPGHGEDDFNVGKQYNLEVLCPVDYKGVMTKEAQQYEGLFYEACTEKVILDLEESNKLLKILEIKHSYPHDWRTKKPIIFRATPQWFASIEPVKEDILNAIKKVNWNPKWGELRISNMIKDRFDWCISRQRVWGVPIPVFYTENDEAILDPEVIEHVGNLFKEHGSNIWFSKEAKDLLPKGYKHEGSPNNIFRKETDIMDVWFDSGSSHKLLERRGLKYPADLYLEGSDQYRGWFNSSIITGVSTTGIAPYKTVLSHGFTLDGNGRKMSKSLGNTIDPIKVSNEMGADILRLWVASIDYTSDMPLSQELLKQVTESYRKIRNTLKFLLSNISDFDPKNRISYDKLEDVDKFMTIKLNKYIESIKNKYDNFEFGDIYRETIQFIANTLSSFYLDFTKDILYIEHPTSNKRLSVQTVFYDVLLALTKLLAPIIPHTMSDCYSNFSHKKFDDIYLEDMPLTQNIKDENIENTFDSFLKIRDQINKSLEEARANKVIGKSLNAEVILSVTKEQKSILDKISNLSQILIISKLSYNEAKEFECIVKEANGHTCSRCWMLVPLVNNDELCPRCEEIIKKI